MNNKNNKNNKPAFLANAFSLQMLDDLNGTITSKVIDPADVPADVVSAVGHADTAAVLSGILGIDVPACRANVKLCKGDKLYVAQLLGGRLPEGATTLPEGFTLTFLEVTVG